jgi:hypothetical protein
VGWTDRAVAFARAHWVFVTVLVLGAILRVVVQLAYQPALIYWDTYPYMESMALRQPGPVRPFGYSALLLALPLHVGLWVVPLVQHLLGLLMAVGIYVLLLRLGVRRWLSALAAAPVLLDAFQLNIEQQIMSETLFEALILSGLIVLLWHRRPGILATAGAGLLFSAALLTRPNALLIIGPAVLAVFFLRGIRAGIAPATVLVVAFVTPVVAYAFWFQAYHGIYNITSFEGPSTYARVATIVDCATVEIPDYERVLCPTEPIPLRLPQDNYIWSPESPRHDVVPPPGMTKEEVTADFARRVIRQQPLRYVRSVAYDFIRGFAPVRTSGPKDVAVARWEFHHQYPLYNAQATYDLLARYDHGRPAVVPELTALLVPYSHIGVTRGPLLLAALLAALAAAAGIGRAKTSGLRAAAFLFASVTVAVLLPSSILIFSWRYQLPQYVFLPPAGALALTALVGWRDTRPEPAEGTLEPAPAPASSRAG